MSPGLPKEILQMILAHTLEDNHIRDSLSKRLVNSTFDFFITEMLVCSNHLESTNGFGISQPSDAASEEAEEVYKKRWSLFPELSKRRTFFT
ncbi:hypothetical protein BDV19DRAFT_390691 [Aspergillus venezuelensis]